MSEVESSLSSEEVLKLLGGMQTAVEATTSSATPLLTKYVLCYYACILPFVDDAGSGTRMHLSRPPRDYHFYFFDHSFCYNPYII